MRPVCSTFRKARIMQHRLALVLLREGRMKTRSQVLWVPCGNMSPSAVLRYAQAWSLEELCAVND